MNARQRPLSDGFCQTYSVQVQINIDSKLQMIHLSQRFQGTNARSQPALSVCPLDTMDLLGDRYCTSDLLKGRSIVYQQRKVPSDVSDHLLRMIPSVKAGL